MQCHSLTKKHNSCVKMKSKVYKWCAVPLCKSTSIATPNKLFVFVPKKKSVRDNWLKLAWRDPTDVLTNSTIYFCEDHFDLPTDMANYMQYHLLGSVSQVLMKPGCIPKKFACQPDRNIHTSDNIEPPYYIPKKRKMKTLACSIECFHFDEFASKSSVQHNLQETQQATSKMIDKSIQDSPRETEDRNEFENYEMDSLLGEMPEVVIKVEHIEESDLVTTDTPPPDFKFCSQESYDVPARQTSFEDEFDHFGKDVAEQLRTLPLIVALETQEMLLSVLKKQRLKVLDNPC